MSNLRIIEIEVIDSTTIKAQFTAELDPLLNTSNVSIAANDPGIPDPDVIKVKISKNSMTITTRPLTPIARYFVTFQSTSLLPFKSKDGTAYLVEDGKTNVPMIIGAEDPDNIFRDILINFLKDNVYSLENGTLIRTVLNAQANTFARALYDIRQAKNDNYLMFIVGDESKTRGSGAFDRLNEEGAYEIIRVGKQTTGSTTSGSKTFAEFPYGPITLQANIVTNEILLPATSGTSTFDHLILTVAHGPVVQVTSIVFLYGSGSTYTYNISTMGYQLKNARYDKDHASTYMLLEDDQIKLSDELLDSGVIIPGSGDRIRITYEYQNLGKIITNDSVIVTQVNDAIREETPPILNQFDLKYAPIVTSSDVICTSGGVQFLDPMSNPPFCHSPCVY